MRKMRIVSFCIPADLSEGVKRVAEILNFVSGSPAELTVKAEHGEANTLTLTKGTAMITYTAPHMFFRLLGLLLEHADEECYTCREETPFETVGMKIGRASCRERV